MSDNVRYPGIDRTELIQDPDVEIRYPGLDPVSRMTRDGNIERGSALPTNPENGDLFNLTGGSNPGLYRYYTNQWILLAAGNAITDAQAAAIVANTAKVGITPQQAADILRNNIKVGITQSQTDDIDANNRKTGITQAQARDILINNDKTGITPAQAAQIAVNNTKVGITTQQSNEITVNTGKTGITTAQADAIAANTAAIENINVNPTTGITQAQANAIIANTAKTGITPDQAAQILVNNAKVGITPQQTADILTNNAKVTITADQAAAIVANTVKVGISQAQATNIADNVTDIADLQGRITTLESEEDANAAGIIEHDNEITLIQDQLIMSGNYNPGTNTLTLVTHASQPNITVTGFASPSAQGGFNDQQALEDFITDKAAFREDIGAGTSSFSGSYDDLTDVPTTTETVRQIFANAILSTTAGWVDIDPVPTGFDSGVTVVYNSTTYHYLYTATAGILVTDLTDIAGTTLYTQTY